MTAAYQRNTFTFQTLVLTLLSATTIVLKKMERKKDVQLVRVVFAKKNTDIANSWTHIKMSFKRNGLV